MIFSVPISTAATSLLKVALVLAWLAAGGFVQRWQVLRRNPLVWTALALYAVILASGFYSPAPLDAVLFQWSKYNKILFLIPAITLLQEPVWRQRALHAFLLAMGITLVASLVHVFWAFPGAGATKALLNGDANAANNHYIFKNHIEQNIMMTFLVLACALNALHCEGSRRMAWATVALCGVVDIVFFVSGRTGYVTLAGAILVLVVSMVPAQKRLPALLGAIALGAGLMLASPNLQHRFQTVVQEVGNRDVNGISTSSGQRVEFWTNSVRLIQEKPLVGWGAGAYGREFCRVASTPEWCRLGAESHPHNQTLYLGVESGLLGMIALWVFQLTPLWMARRYSPKGRTLVLGLTAILWIDGLFNVPLYALTEAYFFVFMLSALLADYPARVDQAADTA